MENRSGEKLFLNQKLNQYPVNLLELVRSSGNSLSKQELAYLLGKVSYLEILESRLEQLAECIPVSLRSITANKSPEAALLAALDNLIQKLDYIRSSHSGMISCE